MLFAVAGALVGVALWPLAMFLLVRVVLPRRRVRIAERQAPLVADAVDLGQVLDGVQVTRLYTEIEQPLLQSVDHIVRDTMAEHLDTWESVPSIVQDMTVKQVQVAAPSIVAGIVDGFRSSARGLVDLRAVAAVRLGEPATAARSVRLLLRPAAPVALVGGGVAGLVLGFLASLVPASLTTFAVVGAVCAGVLWLLAAVVGGRKPADRYARLLADAVFAPADLVAAVPSDEATALAGRAIAGAVDERALLVAPTLTPTVVAGIRRSASIRAAARIEPLTRRAERYLRSALATTERLERALPSIWLPMRRAVLRDAWWLLVLGAVIGSAAGAVVMALTSWG